MVLFRRNASRLSVYFFLFLLFISRRIHHRRLADIYIGPEAHLLNIDIYSFGYISISPAYLFFSNYTSRNIFLLSVCHKVLVPSTRKSPRSTTFATSPKSWNSRKDREGKRISFASLCQRFGRASQTKMRGHRKLFPFKKKSQRFSPSSPRSEEMGRALPSVTAQQLVAPRAVRACFPSAPPRMRTNAPQTTLVFTQQPPLPAEKQKYKNNKTETSGKCNAYERKTKNY